jgi:hypothetical protein
MKKATLIPGPPEPAVGDDDTILIMMLRHWEMEIRTGASVAIEDGEPLPKELLSAEGIIRSVRGPFLFSLFV